MLRRSRRSESFLRTAAAESPIRVRFAASPGSRGAGRGARMRRVGFSVGGSAAVDDVETASDCTVLDYAPGRRPACAGGEMPGQLLADSEFRRRRLGILRYRDQLQRLLCESCPDRGQHLDSIKFDS